MSMPGSILAAAAFATTAGDSSVATDASTTATVAGGSYNDELVVRMHSYARERFDAALFEPSADPHRPPVFLAEHADSNLLRPPDAELASSVVTMVPRAARHRWFRSMKSSQALTQSVFGALAATGHLAALGALTAECGRSAFTEEPNQLDMTLERDVSWLGEPRPTSIDVCFESPRYRIAVECKLSESVFGTCSRPATFRIGVSSMLAAQTSGRRLPEGQQGLDQ